MLPWNSLFKRLTQGSSVHGRTILMLLAVLSMPVWLEPAWQLTRVLRASCLICCSKRKEANVIFLCRHGSP